MDSTGKHPSPLRVAAVVSFYMFAALVVCPSDFPPHLIGRSSLPDGFCVRFSVDLLSTS